MAVRVAIFVVLSLFVPMLLGYPFEKQKHSIPMNSTPEAPKPCCFPDQYETLMGLYLGTATPKTSQGHLTQVDGKISVDFTNERVYALEQVIIDGKSTIVRVIQDYKGKITYSIVGDKCYKTPIVAPLIHCIPDNAVFLGNFYYGVSNTLPTNTWSMVTPGIATQVILTVTEEECLPLGQVAFGTIGGKPGLMSVGYVNTTMGIKDPSVFDIPKICKTDHSFADDKFLHDMIPHKIRHAIMLHNQPEAAADRENKL